MMLERDPGLRSLAIGTASVVVFVVLAPFGRKRTNATKPPKPQETGIVSATPAALAQPALTGLTPEFRADKTHEMLLRPPPTPA